MHIVVDIPEEVYRAYKMDVTLSFLNADQRSTASWYLISGLVDGTPLPKGHGRLIDADKIRIRRASDSIIEPNVEMAIQAVKQYIDQLPTIVESEDEK